MLAVGNMGVAVSKPYEGADRRVRVNDINARRIHLTQNGDLDPARPIVRLSRNRDGPAQELLNPVKLLFDCPQASIHGIRFIDIVRQKRRADHEGNKWYQ